MAENTARWRVWRVLLVVSLAATACAGDLATPSGPTPTLAPTPSIFFIQQKPVDEDELKGEEPGVVRKKVYMLVQAIGELVLVDGCLRLKAIGSDTSYLLVWPPEFSLHTENDEIRILDGDGQVVARVWEEVCMGGGGRSAAHLSEHVQQQLPPDCPGPYWMVGLSVRPNVRHDSDLVTVDLISTADRALFLLRKKPVLDGWAIEEAPLTGKLVLFDRCPHIMPDYSPVDYYTPVWPPDYSVSVKDGEVEIVDGTGQVVARVGEEVQVGGGKIPKNWDWEEYRRLRDDLPGECIGPYWIIRE